MISQKAPLVSGPTAHSRSDPVDPRAVVDRKADAELVGAAPARPAISWPKQRVAESRNGVPAGRCS